MKHFDLIRFNLTFIMKFICNALYATVEEAIHYESRLD